MSKRVIKVGVMSYLTADGLPAFGMHGQEVDVHGDDLERFDRLNVMPEAKPDEVAEPEQGGDTEPEAKKPATRRR